MEAEDVSAETLLVNLDRWEFFSPQIASACNPFEGQRPRGLVESRWYAQIITAATLLLMRMRRGIDGNVIPPHDYSPNVPPPYDDPRVDHMERRPGMFHESKIYLSEKIVGSWEGDRIAWVSDSKRISNRLTAACLVHGVTNPAALFDLCMPEVHADSRTWKVNREDYIRGRFGSDVIPEEGMPPPWLKDITWDLMPALERLMGIRYTGATTVYRNPETSWSVLSEDSSTALGHLVRHYRVREELLATIPPKTKLRFADAEDPTPATVVRPSKRQLGW